MSNADSLERRLHEALSVAATNVEARTELPSGVPGEATIARRRSKVWVPTVALAAVSFLAVAGAIALRGSDGAKVTVSASDANSPMQGSQATFPAASSIPSEALGLRAPSASAVGESLLLFGGTDAGGAAAGSDAAPEARLGGAQGSGLGYRYSPGASQWRSIAESPLSPRTGQVSVMHANEVVIAGGSMAVGRGPALADAAAYSAATDSWRSVPALPVGLTNAVGVSAGDLVAIGGGFSDRGSHDSSVLVGDTKSPWQRLEVSHPVHGLVGVGSRVFPYGLAANGAVFEVSVIDMASRGVVQLPGLPVDGVLLSQTVASDGESVFVMLQTDVGYTVYTLNPETKTWRKIRSFYSAKSLGAGEPPEPEAPIQSLVHDDALVTANSTGVFRISLDSDDLESWEFSDRHCTSTSSGAITATQAFVWRDSGCGDRLLVVGLKP